MAIKRTTKNGKIYAYDGDKLVSVTPVPSKDRRAAVAEKNKGQVYQAGKGFTPRKATQRTYTTAPQLLKT